MSQKHRRGVVRQPVILSAPIRPIGDAFSRRSAQDDRDRRIRAHEGRKHANRALQSIPVTLVLVLALCSGTNFAQSTPAGSRPAVELNVEHAVPREVNETVHQALVRDYAAAWQALENALANNNAAALSDNFVGFAQGQLTRRIEDQKQAGLKTRIVDRGHKAEALFYSPEGAAIELRDAATLETQILDGETVIHSESNRVYYYAILTGAEDRWKVRVLESCAGTDSK